MKKSDNPNIKLRTALKFVTLLTFNLFLFYSIANMTLYGSIFFLTEFNKAAHGVVERAERIGKGRHVFLDSGEDFYWKIHHPLPKAGDTFHKEKYSFRYMVNGKNCMTKEDALSALTVPFLPYKYAFIVFCVMLIFQFIYYRIYEKSPQVAFREMFEDKSYSKMASKITMFILPAVFAYYLFWLLLIPVFL